MPSNFKEIYLVLFKWCLQSIWTNVLLSSTGMLVKINNRSLTLWRKNHALKSYRMIRQKFSDLRGLQLFIHFFVKNVDEKCDLIHFHFLLKTGSVYFEVFTLHAVAAEGRSIAWPQLILHLTSTPATAAASALKKT